MAPIEHWNCGGLVQIERPEKDDHFLRQSLNKDYLQERLRCTGCLFIKRAAFSSMTAEPHFLSYAPHPQPQPLPSISSSLHPTLYNLTPLSPLSPVSYKASFSLQSSPVVNTARWSIGQIQRSLRNAPSYSLISATSAPVHTPSISVSLFSTMIGLLSLASVLGSTP